MIPTDYKDIPKGRKKQSNAAFEKAKLLLTNREERCVELGDAECDKIKAKAQRFVQRIKFIINE